MRKFLLLLFVTLILNQVANAAVGDTTWVQAHSTVQMPNYGNYDTTINFPAPGTSYRRIYMIVTLGKYVCPGSPTYCGDWDYTFMTYLMTPGGDTLELGRLITPYANSGAPRTPATWKQRYVYDVTDYVSKLHNSATMRILYSGYSGGFTADIKFAFIEGTPDRNVQSIKRLWHGTFGYGGTPDINTNFTSLPQTAAAGALSSALKFTITGHGYDNNQCCEFMNSNYAVILNGAAGTSNAIWRADCGSNELYPQSGTWVYDRANWCPGALVHHNIHPLAGITGGNAFTLGIQFAPYVSTGIPAGGSSPVYIAEATLFDYAGLNKTLDASLDDIVAPSNNENHFRENPTSTSPTVHVKNTGSTAITSIAFSYTVDGGTASTYTWSGSLASLAETDIVMPVMADLKAVAGVSGTHIFAASITSVNGTVDDDASNNAMTSSFATAPKWPSVLKILFKTNNEATTPGGTVSETTWKIFDENNAVIASRTNCELDKLYTDTVTLPLGGSYRLLVEDGGCDGLQWWAAGSGVTAGYLQVKKINNAFITMNGYNYGGQYNNDFGCSFSQYFTTEGTVGVDELADSKLGIEAYPNPASHTVNVDIMGLQQVSGTVTIVDVLGRVVTETSVASAHNSINIESLQNGLYTIVFTDSKQPANKLTARLIVAK